MSTESDRVRVVAVEDQAWACAEPFLDEIELTATKIPPANWDDRQFDVARMCMCIVAARLRMMRADRKAEGGGA